MDSRQQFEEWVNRECPGADLRHMGDNSESYVNSYVREQWTGWQASRESLEVDLGSMTNNGYEGFYPATQIKRALRDSGIRTK